ncbi:hypothetical protein [Faecalibacterium taiwanense]|uniref:hypothetical protein n=1 Tax=Faecalibacterium taiwanense TaxID=3030638 RepID=UPI002FC950C7
MTFVSDTSQSQIKEVVRYLKRVSWDFCGIELLYSDLIDMTIEANKNGQELFDVVTDAKTFANSVKNELNRLTIFDYFLVLFPPFLFWGWGIEGLVLLLLVPQFEFGLSLGYLIQFSICLISACVLLRRIMEKVGFPPSKHRMKFAAFMVAYVITLYLVGLVLNNFWGNIVLIHFSAPLLTLGCLLIGSLCYFIRFYFYEHDRRLDSRV